jgi:hypothetical protein
MNFCAGEIAKKLWLDTIGERSRPPRSASLTLMPSGRPIDLTPSFQFSPQGVASPPTCGHRRGKRLSSLHPKEPGRFWRSSRIQ